MFLSSFTLESLCFNVIVVKHGGVCKNQVQGLCRWGGEELEKAISYASVERLQYPDTQPMLARRRLDPIFMKHSPWFK